jgi:hypothetical protein
MIATPLPTRTIGPITVSALGLGCMNLSHAYLPRPDAAEAERLLVHALDAGKVARHCKTRRPGKRRRQRLQAYIPDASVRRPNRLRGA